MRYKMPFFENQFLIRPLRVLRQNSSENPCVKRFSVLLNIFSDYLEAGRIFAILFSNNQFLRDIDKAARKISGMRGLKRGIRRSFSGAVCRDKIFQNVKAFLVRR